MKEMKNSRHNRNRRKISFSLLRNAWNQIISHKTSSQEKWKTRKKERKMLNVNEKFMRHGEKLKLKIEMRITSQERKSLLLVGRIRKWNWKDIRRRSTLKSSRDRASWIFFGVGVRFFVMGKYWYDEKSRAGWNDDKFIKFYGGDNLPSLHILQCNKLLNEIYFKVNCNMEQWATVDRVKCLASGAKWPWLDIK